ncbi:MAG: hypothetical protein WD512_04690, partial [Candidatus Paceibacterota bacterium]
LSELGQKQLTKGFTNLSEAKTPIQVANAIVNIEQNKNQGARLSEEQEQQLLKAKEDLKSQGYEIVNYNIVRDGENTIIQVSDLYDSERDVLTEDQANAIASKINSLEKRGETITPDDLPFLVSRTIKPLIKKEGKMVQAAEVNILIFETVEQAREAIKKSKEAGYKKPNAADKINAKYNEELATLERAAQSTTQSTTQTTNFTRENVIKVITDLAFKQASDVGNMIDNLIKDFLTREGINFKKITRPEKMSQKAFDALFGAQGVITKFRDGVIDGDYIVIGASDMLFDKSLFENGLVGETDLIAIDADGNFSIIDVKALQGDSWKRFAADLKLEELTDDLIKKGVSEEDIEKNVEIIDLKRKAAYSKRQYFRIQQSLYRNLFYNMTGIMPLRIGLLPLDVTYDNEGNLIDAKLSDLVPLDRSTLELEYFS